MTTMIASASTMTAELASPKQQIVDLVQGFSFETTPGSAAKILDYREHLHPGTTVSVTFLPGSDFATTIETATRLRTEGFEPAPHFAARSIPSKGHLDEWLRQLRDQADITQAVCLAGAVNESLGPFSSSMDLLETGLFDRHGIRRIGVAGHPEGSPDIGHQALTDALAWKNDFADQSDAELYIVTQFCFEAAPIIAWDRTIRAAGNRLPIHIGVPGLATLKTLINHARACGIGPSMRFLTRQARNVAKLMSVNAPDRLLVDLAAYQANDPDCGIHRVHFYPLGGLKRSAAWANAVLDNDFTLKRDGRGFGVNREIP